MRNCSLPGRHITDCQMRLFMSFRQTETPTVAAAKAADAGRAFAFLVLGGNVFGLLAPIVTGYIVQATGSFASAFVLAGVLALVGAVLSLLLTRNQDNLQIIDIAGGLFVMLCHPQRRGGGDIFLPTLPRWAASTKTGGRRRGHL
jgi:MFS family permease